MYHKVAAAGPGAKIRSHYVHPSAFRRQIRLLKSLGYQSVSPADACQKTARDIAITFDDGYANFQAYALPCLLESGFGATVFAVTGLLGGTDEWDGGQEPLMTRDQLVDCGRQGIEIGSHTVNHADLTAVPPEIARRELQESRDFLIECGFSNPGFCYPYGRQDDSIREVVREVGYPYACGTRRGANDSTTNMFDLHRVNIRSDTSLPVFLFKLLRARRGR